MLVPQAVLLLECMWSATCAHAGTTHSCSTHYYNILLQNKLLQHTPPTHTTVTHYCSKVCSDVPLNQISPSPIGGVSCSSLCCRSVCWVVCVVVVCFSLVSSSIESGGWAPPQRVLQRALQQTSCNTRQHTATHCNILQHTVTHYNNWNKMWGSGVPILPFLRFEPTFWFGLYPSEDRYSTPIKWYWIICNTEVLYQ